MMVIGCDFHPVGNKLVGWKVPPGRLESSSWSKPPDKPRGFTDSCPAKKARGTKSPEDAIEAESTRTMLRPTCRLSPSRTRGTPGHKP
jgi:hypothetical protein